MVFTSDSHWVASPFENNCYDVLYLQVTVIFDPNGTKAITGGMDNKVCIWSVETGEQLFCLSVRFLFALQKRIQIAILNILFY